MFFSKVGTANYTTHGVKKNRHLEDERLKTPNLVVVFTEKLLL
jgi:hypothetical protein